MKLSPASPADSLSRPTREEIRRRFLADRQSSNGGKPPEIDLYVADLPDPERSQVRAELEALQDGTAEFPAQSDATIDSIPPTPAPALKGGTIEELAKDDSTIDSLPAEYAPAPVKGSTQGPRKDLGTLEDVHPDGPGTMDFVPSGPNLANGPANQTAKQADAEPYSIGNYDLISILGRGAMGVVYKAIQRGLKRTVALKMILSGGHASELELGRFRSEAEAVAQLQHPNIVQIYEVGESEGRPFFSLEFVDGMTLSQKVRDKPIAPEESARICKQIALGMDFAHKRGIIHRDLKPANILLTSDGIPKISDFGLAKRLEDEDSGMTRTGTVLGTPSYMAPEQAEGKLDKLGPRSDVYSLGAILYDLLTGRAPFRGTTILETLEQVRTREPVPPLQLQPDVPPDLETICLKCLQKDPQRRYGSAAELAADLDRFLNGEPILARPVGRVERTWRWCKRYPWIAGLSAAIVLLIVSWALTSSALAYDLAVQKKAADDNAAAALTSAAEAERQEGIAKANALDAEAKAKIARDNEAEAKRQEGIAKDNAVLAERNADNAIKQAILAKQNEDSAKGTAAATIDSMVDLGRSLNRNLQAKRNAAKTSPELQKARDEMIATLRVAMKEVSKKIDRAAGTNFGEVGMYQKLADLFMEIGISDEADVMFKRAYDMMVRKVELNPDSDLARGNLGVMEQRLGEIPFKLHGDARIGLKHYRKARDLHADVMAHPRDHFFADSAIKSIVGHSEFNVAEALLALGDPAQARKHYEECLRFRQEVFDANPNQAVSRMYLLLVRTPLGVTCSFLADEKAMREHFEEAFEMGNELLKQLKEERDQIRIKTYLAAAYGAHGDALVRLDKFADAQDQYQKAQEFMKEAVKFAPDDIAQKPLEALTYERLGLAADRAEKKPDAEKYFAEALKVRVELLRLEPNSLSRQAAYVLALARTGKHAEAAAAATKVRAKLSDHTEPLLQLARSFAVCAGADSTKKATYLDQAMESLKAATKKPFKNTALLKSDPELAPLHSRPDFQNMVTQAKPR